VLIVVSVPEVMVLVAERILTFPLVFYVVQVCVVPIVLKVDTEPVERGPLLPWLLLAIAAVAEGMLTMTLVSGKIRSLPT